MKGKIKVKLVNAGRSKPLDMSEELDVDEEGEKMSTEMPTIHPELFKGENPGVCVLFGVLKFWIYEDLWLDVDKLGRRNRHRFACENIVLYERDFDDAVRRTDVAYLNRDDREYMAWKDKQKQARELRDAWRKWREEKC